MARRGVPVAVEGATVKPGALIAAARERHGLVLKEVASALGLSVPFIHDVCHDNRTLAKRFWKPLVKLLPSLTLRDLAEATVDAGPVEIDPRDLTPRQRKALVDALLADVERGG